MTTRHAARTVRIFGLYHDAVNGEHFSVIRSGTWAEVTEYLSKTVRFTGPRRLFIEGTDGALRPLMG